MTARCIFMTFSIWNFELQQHAIGFVLIRKYCVYMCTTLKNFSYLCNVQCAYHLAKMRTGEYHLEIPETVGRTSWMMTASTRYPSEVKIWKLHWLEGKYFTGLNLHWSVVPLVKDMIPSFLRFSCCTDWLLHLHPLISSSIYPILPVMSCKNDTLALKYFTVSNFKLMIIFSVLTAVLIITSQSNEKQFHWSISNKT